MASDPSDGLLQRAFRVLGAFGPRRTELTLAELTEIAGLPRSTTHRLATRLAALGALERTPRGWCLGVRMFELGQLVPTQQRLRELALAHMGDLYEATHETIQLATLDGPDVIYVEVLSGHLKVPTPSRRGGRLPAHCTALGKALLAFRPADQPLPAGPLTRRTPTTIVDRERLERELREVRETALAYDREEAMEGLTCVAAPVFGPRGAAVAALSVSMPSGGLLTPAHAAPAVRMAALALTRELSGKRRRVP